jgi:hypothetical protein
MAPFTVVERTADAVVVVPARDTFGIVDAFMFVAARWSVPALYLFLTLFGAVAPIRLFSTTRFHFGFRLLTTARICPTFTPCVDKIDDATLALSRLTLDGSSTRTSTAAPGGSSTSLFFSPFLCSSTIGIPRVPRVGIICDATRSITALSLDRPIV